MNTKLLLKTLFLILVLLALVLMGMENRQTVEFSMPPVLSSKIKQPAAIMYYVFFAIGVLTGTILTAGSKGGGRSQKSEK
ncbi:MAG: hypothetical protein N3J91_06605 [Verrucomicrobiae bacterium]|nr:hypothetical protein [Verrucomicrobiae bacterium]